MKCQAKTRKGKECKNQPLLYTNYCHSHQGWEFINRYIKVPVSYEIFDLIFSMVTTLIGQLANSSDIDDIEIELNRIFKQEYADMLKEYGEKPMDNSEKEVLASMYNIKVDELLLNYLTGVVAGLLTHLSHSVEENRKDILELSYNTIDRRDIAYYIKSNKLIIFRCIFNHKDYNNLLSSFKEESKKKSEL
jgi:hypothetical protein